MSHLSMHAREWSTNWRERQGFASPQAERFPFHDGNIRSPQMHAARSLVCGAEFPGRLGAVSQQLNIIEYRERKPHTPDDLGM